MTPPTPRLWVGRDQLRGLADRIDILCRELRDERAAMERTDDPAYLNAVAALDEVIRLETAPMLMRPIAERRPSHGNVW